MHSVSFKRIAASAFILVFLNTFAVATAEEFTGSEIYSTINADCERVTQYPAPSARIELRLKNEELTLLTYTIEGVREASVGERYGLNTTRNFNGLPPYTDIPVTLLTEAGTPRTEYYWNCRKTPAVLRLVCGGSVRSKQSTDIGDPNVIYRSGTLNYIDECKNGDYGSDGNGQTYPNDNRTKTVDGEVESRLANMNFSVEDEVQRLETDLSFRLWEASDGTKLSAYTQLCDKAYSSRSCRDASFIYNDGGQFGDPRKHREYAAKACDYGDALSCKTIGLIYSDGIGVSRDGAKALRYFERSCALNETAAYCEMLGMSLYYGFDGVQDRTRGMRYIKLACDGGMRRACQHVR